MLIDNGESVIVSSLGWTDRNSIWILDVASEQIEKTEISEAKYISLHKGQGDHFAVVHHLDGNTLEISAHSFKAPETSVSKAVIDWKGNRLEGDHEVWKQLPRAYVAYSERTAGSDFFLFIIDPVRMQIEIHDLSWYDDSYDKGYQGVIGVIEVPGEDVLIISVQRDSHPVLYSPEERRLIGKLSLAERHGNPTLTFRRKAKELWANDYDTLLRLDPTDWGVKNSLLLQEADKGCMQFIGDFAFNRDETLCAVARPFSADVIALDTTNFRVTHQCRLGHQPLEVALLSDGRVYARDWKSGTLLKGKFKRKWFT